MAGYRAFLAEDSENYKYNLTYYHNPNRWRDNIIALDNPIRNVENWSAEIKYLNESMMIYQTILKTCQMIRVVFMCFM